MNINGTLHTHKAHKRMENEHVTSRVVIKCALDVVRAQCARSKTNVLTVDTMWTVEDKCERTHKSFWGDVGARC